MEDFTFYAAKPVEKYHKVDILLVISVILLWGLGIFTIYITSQDGSANTFSSSFKYVSRQLISSGVGFALLLFFAILNMRYIRKIIPFIVIGSLILCIITLLPWFSVESHGARRWIKIGSFSFQPSELVKFAVILFIANFFDKQHEKKELYNEDTTVLPCVLGLIVFVAMVFMQKDLSTALIILAVGILMFFVCGEKLRWFWPFLLIAIPALFLLVFMEPYRVERIIGFVNPEELAGDINYQPINARKAIIAGGIWGNGIGQGLQRIKNIPEVQADFIFAGWVEAMGLAGVIAYLGVLVLFAIRGFKTAFKNPSRFVSYTSFGCVLLIVLQSLLNCMVVCGLLPTTGIPLPFFSLGGSSVIVTLAMSGFLINASTCQEIAKKEKEIDENNFETLIGDLS